MVIIEVVIGVIIGGISGYFGGAVDTALMRFVDLFNSIPFYPVVIIFGSVMDTLEVDPMARIFILMMVLGILSWTGVARWFAAKSSRSVSRTLWLQRKQPAFGPDGGSSGTWSRMSCRF